MTNKYVLGIDTSNYKTSVAIIDAERNIICDIRRFLQVKQGERGLRQSDALFQHIKNLPELLENALVGISSTGELQAVAYSSRPRPVEGSYMPVFLAGESHARSIAAALDIPVFAFSHQEGHIEAIRTFSPFQKDRRFLACHFSGGTSELLLVAEKQEGQTAGYEIEIIGGSKDIAFGQVIDRAGVALGMKFPAGEAMDRIADGTEQAGKRLTDIKVTEAFLNLSGIDTQMKRCISELLPGNITENTSERNMLIKELFEKLAMAMAKMILQGADKTGVRDVIMAGGVASSKFMRKGLSTILSKGGIRAAFDERELSADNAVGTALLGGKSIWR